MTSFLTVGEAGLVSAAVCFTLIKLLLRTDVGSRISDIPNARSLHTAPVPKIGGLGMVAGVAASCAIFGISILLPLAASALAIVILSVCDDIWDLSVLLRFSIHTGAAFWVVWYYPSVWWLSLLAVVSTVWMSNLYNFMDGIDGLAGGMAVIGFTTYAIVAFDAHAADICILSVAIASAGLAFLTFNLPPALIFMGDAGSVPIGFLACTVGYVGYINLVWPMWFPVVVFSPFIVDATATLLIRFARGEKVWAAHRSHYYQRMALAGFGHAATVRIWYALIVIVAAGALVARVAPTGWRVALLLLLCVTYLAAMYSVDRMSEHNEKAASR